MKRFAQVFPSYSKVSTIHGVSYLANKSSRIEFIFWTCSLVVSAVLFSVSIFRTTQNFLSDQIVFKQSSEIKLIGNFPFPAVTICVESPVLQKRNIWQKKLENYSVTEEDLAAYQLLDLLYDQHIIESINKSASREAVMPAIGKYFADLDLSPFTARFKNIVGTPFNKILTKWGLCHSFNLPPAESLLYMNRVSPDFHYVLPSWYKETKTNDEEVVMPWKVEGYRGISIYRADIASWFSERNLDSFHVIVHNSDEFPVRSGHHFYVQVMECASITFRCDLTVIDDDLLSWAPEKRGCYLDGEKPLKFFKIYTKVNCEHECLSAAMLKACGCMPFYMIRGPGDRVCGVIDRSCYSTIEEGFTFEFNCQCLEQCTRLQYQLILDRTYYAHLRIHQTLILNPYDVTLTPTVKCPAVKISDFLGAVGGLLGLVAGISVFSILELVFTILKCARVICGKTKVHPIIIVQPKTQHQQFTLNQKHLLYRFGLNFLQFLEKSDIHGVHYINDKKLNWLEKIFWIISIAVSTILCSILIADSLESLHANSVIIGFDDKILSKEEIPFPEISFCPDSDAARLVRSLYCLWVNECDGMNKPELLAMMTTLKSVSTLCAYNWLEMFDNTFGPELENSSYPNMTFADHLEVFTDQNWTNQNSFCWDTQTEFEKTAPSLTSQSGLCFILNPEQDDHSKLQFSPHVSGKYVTSCRHSNKVKHGMTMELKRTRDAFSSPSSPSIDPKVPYTCLMDIGHLYVRSKCCVNREAAILVEKQKSYSLVLNPLVTTGDESLRKIPPKERGCYFEDEKELKYFTKYTQANCIAEYISEMQYEICGCVHFEKPRSANMKQCDQNSNGCITGITTSLNDYSSQAFKNVDCLAACNDIIYQYKRIENEISPNHRQNYNSTPGKFNLEADVSIYFDSDDYVVKKRYPSYGFVIMLSNIGGFLGLFLGVSLLSIVETVYFFTLRFFNNLWLKRFN